MAQDSRDVVRRALAESVTMSIPKTYDLRCRELAKAFLADESDLNTDDMIHALALVIQQSIEDEIDFMRNGWRPGQKK